MARNVLVDYLLSHEFHLIDIDPTIGVPPWVFTPTFGFSAISTPEISIEEKTITEGTSDYVRSALGKATVSGITLSRGVTMLDSDFWRWTQACLHGNKPEGLGLSSLVPGKAPPIPGKRRNFLLLHLTGLSSSGFEKAASSGINNVPRAAESLFKGIASAAGGLSEAIGFLGITSVPAKAYVLLDCLPVRYKPGSDFDASTSQVSIQELEIKPELFEEFALLA
jgi:phage tail-like protein